MPWAIKNLNLPEVYAINCIDINIIDANFNGRQIQRRTCYENHFRNRPISGGCDLPCFRPERISALHSVTTSERCRGPVHGCPVRLAFPVVDLRVSGHPRCTSAGQPLRALGASCPCAGDRQHSLLPRFDGPEWASACHCRCSTVDLDLRRGAIGLCRVIPVALAGTGLRRCGMERSLEMQESLIKKEKVSAMT